jgi:hypothetical protein
MAAGDIAAPSSAGRAPRPPGDPRPAPVGPSALSGTKVVVRLKPVGLVTL